MGYVGRYDRGSEWYEEQRIEHEQEAYWFKYRKPIEDEMEEMEGDGEQLTFDFSSHNS
jgi:hypothetical protein